MRVNSFPRSGNLFTQSALEQCFPSVKWPWFSHSSGLLSKQKCVIVLRNPKQCVPSWMLFASVNYLDTVKWYLRFHKELKSNFDKHLIFTFEDLVSQPEKIINTVGNTIGIEPLYKDLSGLGKNKSNQSYVVPNNNSIQDCIELYKELVERLGG
jgi:hypothetical protein